MDAYVFRRIGVELSPILCGARVHKFYDLSGQTLLFVLDAQEQTQKLQLIFKYGRDNPAIFFAPEKPVTPEQPDASVMRLRKYIQGKRIRRVYNHWTERRLVLDFSDQSGTSPLLLILNLTPPPDRPAALLHMGPPDEAEPEPTWPAPSDLPRLLAEGESWREFSTLTPLLRKTLPLLDAPDQAALLVDLQYGEGDIFVYEAPEPEASNTATAAGHRPLLAAWPLPEALRQGRVERVFPYGPNCALNAAQYCFADAAMDSINQTARTALREEESRARKSEKRLAARLDEEERKLLEWCAGKENALLLQANLHRFAKDFKTDSLSLDGTEGQIQIALDPELTVGDNMRRLFRLAAKGARGLEHLKRRRAELAARVDAGRHLLEPEPRHSSPPSKAKGNAPAASGKKQARPETIPLKYKNISRFISSDGFIILRGRNAEGNRDLLKLASGHDYWFHAQEGPSAHAILRRAHALDEVSERSLLEAAMLTALKSAWKNDLRADIMVALARDVRPVKGGPPGSVFVDKTLRVLSAPLDPDLEDKLAPPDGTPQKHN